MDERSSATGGPRGTREDLLRALDGEIEDLRQARASDSFTTWALLAALGASLLLLSNVWEQGAMNWADVWLLFLVFSLGSEAVVWRSKSAGEADRPRERSLPIGFMRSPIGDVIHSLVLTGILLHWRQLLPGWVVVVGTLVLGIRALSGIMVLVAVAATPKLMALYVRFRPDPPEWFSKDEERFSHVGRVGYRRGVRTRTILEPVAFAVIAAATVPYISTPVPGTDLHSLKFAALLYVIVCLISAMFGVDSSSIALEGLSQFRRKYLLHNLQDEDVVRGFRLLEACGAPALLALIMSRENVADSMMLRRVIERSESKAAVDIPEALSDLRLRHSALEIAVTMEQHRQPASAGLLSELLVESGRAIEAVQERADLSRPYGVTDTGITPEVPPEDPFDNRQIGGPPGAPSGG